MKAIHHLSIALCLSLPALALAENAIVPTHSRHASLATTPPNAATTSTDSTPVAPDTTTNSADTAVHATNSVQTNKKVPSETDPVPLSDYVNGGYYNQ